MIGHEIFKKNKNHSLAKVQIGKESTSKLMIKKNIDTRKNLETIKFLDLEHFKNHNKPVRFNLGMDDEDDTNTIDNHILNSKPWLSATDREAKQENKHDTRLCGHQFVGDLSTAYLDCFNAPKKKPI
jgi:hypothetical protein